MNALIQELRPDFGRIRRGLVGARQPQRAYSLWFGPLCVCVASIALLLALCSPPEGPGAALCFFHSGTGLPCPGCGLTRSLSCALRGLFLESWHHHPMGLPILTLFIVTVGQRLLPRDVRERFASWMNRHGAIFRGLYLAFVTGFIGFGIVRALLVLGAK